jgi:hypothetical protein
MKKFLACFYFIIYFSISLNSAKAADVVFPEWTVWGTPLSSSSVPVFSAVVKGTRTSTVAPERALEISQANQQLKEWRDVRCIGGAYGNTTSLDAPEIRHLAAEQVYRRVEFWLKFWFYLRRQVGLADGQFRVVYADGGSEMYKIFNPLSSVALTPVPGSLFQSDGVRKERSCVFS